MLLFTEKVSSISVYLWEDKASDTNLLYSANRTTVTDTNFFKDVVHRSVMHNTDLPSDLLIEMKLSTSLSAKCVDYLDLDGEKGQVEEEWIKVASIGKGQAYELCKSELGKSSGCCLVEVLPGVQLRKSLAMYFVSFLLQFLQVSYLSASMVHLLSLKTAEIYGGARGVRRVLLPTLNQVGIMPFVKMLWRLRKSCDRALQAIANGKCGEDPPKVFFKDGLPFSINELQFGDELIQDDQNMFPVFEKVVEQLTNKIVVKLPSWVRKGFSAAECVMCKTALTRGLLFSVMLSFQVLPLIDEDIKNLIAFALSCRDTRVLDLLKKHPCIPCASSSGFICKVPSALLDPTLFKEIFSESEEVYPDTSFLRHLDKYQIETLREIGV
ncbi:putative sacsin [Apostichopus japonicus]|uniref:Putative sacsin n=1 Tax=Stichopus japonicus TaxID=307972 RepID=A0A2G8JT48_STIJA|nr:putative sacsin [Apostichopus japonicus]